MTGISQVQSPAWGSGFSTFPKCFPETAESATALPVLQAAREVGGGGCRLPTRPFLQPGPEQSQHDPAANTRCRGPELPGVGRP